LKARNAEKCERAEQCFGEVFEVHSFSELLDENFHQLLFLIGC